MLMFGKILASLHKHDTKAYLSVNLSWSSKENNQINSIDDIWNGDCGHKFRLRTLWKIKFGNLHFGLHGLELEWRWEVGASNWGPHEGS